MVSNTELNLKYWQKKESCPRQVLSCVILNYHIFQTFNLFVKGIFAFQCTRFLGNMCSTGRKPVGKEDVGKQKNNVKKGKSRELRKFLR